jgi:hypothetical protein
MSIRKVTALVVILVCNRLMFADASYQETSQITGGSLVAPMKSMGFLSKSMRDMFAPITTTTMVHGNQKVVVSKDSTEITDLDRETVTHIDNVHKTYSVVTFAQMRQAFENMPKQMEQAKQSQQPVQQPAQQPKSDLKTSFDVTVKNTGASKEVNGLMAQEQLVTMQMHVTDPNAPPTDAANTVTYVVTTDAWIAPDPPEVKEIQDFDKKFGEKLMAGVDFSAWKAQMTNSNPAMSQMFSGQPGSQDAMAQMAKEMAKLQGTRVMEVTRMGGNGTGPGAAQGSGQAAPAASNSSSGQGSSDAPPQTMSGAIGSALGSSVLGGFHKKKSTPPPSQPAPADSSAAGTQGTSSTTLMEMTMQKSNFSQAPVSSSAFEVPAGFKKVESPGYGAAGK